MTIQTRSLNEINRRGIDALVRELGVAGALRFIGQYTTGQGDYTAERDALLGNETLEELVEQARRVDRERNV